MAQFTRYCWAVSDGRVRHVRRSGSGRGRGVPVRAVRGGGALMKSAMKFWIVGDGTHTLVVTKELNAFTERVVKLSAVAEASRVARSEGYPLHPDVRKALSALDGE